MLVGPLVALAGLRPALSPGHLQPVPGTHGAAADEIAAGAAVTQRLPIVFLQAGVARDRQRTRVRAQRFAHQRPEQPGQAQRVGQARAGVADTQLQGRHMG